MRLENCEVENADDLKTGRKGVGRCFFVGFAIVLCAIVILAGIRISGNLWIFPTEISDCMGVPVSTAKRLHYFKDYKAEGLGVVGLKGGNASLFPMDESDLIKEITVVEDGTCKLFGMGVGDKYVDLSHQYISLGETFWKEYEGESYLIDEFYKNSSRDYKESERVILNVYFDDEKYIKRIDCEILAD